MGFYLNKVLATDYKVKQMKKTVVSVTLVQLILIACVVFLVTPAQSEDTSGSQQSCQYNYQCDEAFNCCINSSLNSNGICCESYSSEVTTTSATGVIITVVIILIICGGSSFFCYCLCRTCCKRTPRPIATTATVVTSNNVTTVQHPTGVQPPGYYPVQQQQPYGTQPAANIAQPAPYGTQAAPYGAQAVPYGAQQATYGAQAAPYGAQPAPYGAQPAPYGAQPATVPYNQATSSYATPPSVHYNQTQATEPLDQKQPMLVSAPPPDQ